LILLDGYCNQRLDNFKSKGVAKSIVFGEHLIPGPSPFSPRAGENREGCLPVEANEGGHRDENKGKPILSR
jgi:hypothetical protein